MSEGEQKEGRKERYDSLPALQCHGSVPWGRRKDPFVNTVEACGLWWEGAGGGENYPQSCWIEELGISRDGGSLCT